MSKMDATKYLRQMKYLPDVTPLCNIFLIIVLIIFPGALMDWSFLPVLRNHAEIKYAVYELSVYSASVTIKKSGKIYFGDLEIEGLSKMKDFLTEKMDELQRKELRIYAEADAPWGKIVDVLNIAKESNIKPVKFMMAKKYSFLAYWETKNRYREKGLKYPEMVH